MRIRSTSLAGLLLLACATPRPAAAQQIALTFDDLPSHASLPPGVTRVDVIRDILAALRAAQVPPVYGFMNAGRLEREPESAPALRMWREAGYPLGNHTYTHMRLNDTTVAAWMADVVRNESLLVSLMGPGDWRWLRYPFLAEGGTPVQRAEARQALAARGYRIASVTMSFDDWAYNDTYARCMARGDSVAVAGLEERWLRSADSALDWYRALSHTLYGRDIPYVLLMHVGALDAQLLPRLLAQYRSRGVSFVSLEQAERDDFYRDDVASAASPAAATLENAARARGIPLTPKGWDSNVSQICR